MALERQYLQFKDSLLLLEIKRVLMNIIDVSLLFSLKIKIGSIN